MIELSNVFIDSDDAVIDVRNKAYRLLLDLNMALKEATLVSIMMSEIINCLLLEKESTTVKFSFSKSMAHYYCHIFISCNQEIYEKIKEKRVARDFSFISLKDFGDCLEFKLKIEDEEFVPDKAFLKMEHERLIKKSGTEMLREIQRKNKELNDALSALKSSSETVQSEKMRALGDLTAGVAHELNNPMMGILNYIQYAIKHTDKEDRKYRPLVDAEREVNRCQSIIDNLLTFSRMKAEGEEESQSEKLSKICRRIIELYTYKIRSHNIEVIENFPEDEPEVWIKANKIQQVILNFINNAIFSMKDCKKRQLSLSVAIFQGTVELKVEDTGHGIDEETLDKIFEPFFTTKKTNEGTGLGLSISKSIIEEHNGTLSCQSDFGKGTCFSIRLPLVK